MKKIQLSLIFILFALIPSQAQTICSGDSVTLTLGVYRGGIQWQESSDSIIWTNIAGATTDAFNLIPSQTTYYRAVVTEGTCLPYYSDTTIVTIINSAPAPPGVISGPATVNSGQGGVGYSISPVSGAASYTWIVPSGAIITGGQGTTGITVDFGSTSGNICVTADNACGTSAPSCIAITVTVLSPCGGITQVQDIDGNWYNTVEIGTQCWTKENLNVTNNPGGSPIIRYCYNDDTDSCTTYGGLYMWNTAMDGSITPGAQGICPTGWHLPTDAEWCILENFVDTTTDSTCSLTGFRGTNVGTILRIGGGSGFDVLPGGIRNNAGGYEFIGDATAFWTSTDDGGSTAWCRIFDDVTSPQQVYRIDYFKDYGYSIRCLKDCSIPNAPDTINGSSNVPSGQTGVSYSIDTVPGATSYTWTVPVGATIASGQGTDSITVDFGSDSGNVCVTATNSCGTSAASCLAVTVDTSFVCGTDSVQDADGNWYNTVLIGTQCWLKENMRTTKYPDSTAITKGPSAQGAAGWTFDIGLYSCPPNVANNAEDCAAAASLGMLYQWSAAMDGDTTEGAQGICPTGWHVPTDAEWITMEEALGMCSGGTNLCSGTACSGEICFRGTNEGSEMANHVADQNWTAHNLTGNAGFGTSGLDLGPSGYRNTFGNYYERALNTTLWSSTESGSSAWLRLLFYTASQVNRGTTSKANVFSVRCVED